MRRYLTAALMVGLAAGAAGAADVAPAPRPAAVHALDGVYRVTAFRMDRLDVDFLRDAVQELTLAGGAGTLVMRHKSAGTEVTAKLKLTLRPDLAGGPAAVDVDFEAGWGITCPGIYKVDGGQLTVAFGHVSSYLRPDPREFVRPKDFKPAQGATIYVFERVEKK